MFRRSLAAHGRRRWVSAIAGVLGLALTVTACGGDDGGSEGGQAGGSDEQIILRFPSWQWGQPGYDEFFSAAIEAFEQDHPNVTFEKIPVASASYVQDIVKMHAANDPPEINQFDKGTFYQAAAAGWYEPLDDRLGETDIQENWSTFLDDAGNVDGNQYGLWISGSAIGFMYNKDMFAEANLEPPTTPEDFMAAAKALTKTNADGEQQYGLSLPSKMDIDAYKDGFAPIIVGMGAGWADDNGEIDVVNETNKEALEFVQELFKSGVTPAGVDRIKSREVFYTGKSAMIMDGPWVMTSALTENPDIMPSLDVTPIPFSNQAASPSNGFAIATNQKHKEEAWEFISMLASQEWQEKYGEMTGVAPGRVGALTDAALEKSPWLTTFADIQEEGHSYFTTGWEVEESEIDTAIADAVTNVFFGDETVDSALERIESDMESMR